MRLASICKVLLLVMLILSFGVEGVHAQQEVIVWFDPLASQVNAGEVTTVRLIVDAQVPVGGFDLIFEYDPNVVILDGWAYGGFLSRLSAIKNEATPGRLWLVAVQLGVPPVSGADVLLEFTLRGVAAGTSALRITQAKFADASGVQYDAGVTDGAITVMAAPLPTPTFTLAPTATTRPATPTSTRTATPRPATQTATATRTSIPVPQATNTPRSATTATFSPPAATRLANALVTPQSIAAAQAGLQQATWTSTPVTEMNTSATQTCEANLAGATLVAMGTTDLFDPTVTPLQDSATSEKALEVKEDTSQRNLTAAIILFDLIVLAFILFLLWKRWHKNKEGKS